MQKITRAVIYCMLHRNDVHDSDMHVRHQVSRASCQVRKAENNFQFNILVIEK